MYDGLDEDANVHEPYNDIRDQWPAIRAQHLDWVAFQAADVGHWPAQLRLIPNSPS
jgi:hypothetical protein